MARYIDAELAIEKCNKLIDNADSCPNLYALEGIRVVRNVILSECETGVPTADVVEVVRCKDCAVPHNKWTGCPNLNGMIPPSGDVVFQKTVFAIVEYHDGTVAEVEPTSIIFADSKINEYAFES